MAPRLQSPPVSAVGRAGPVAAAADVAFGPTAGGVLLRLHVQPGARQAGWAGRHGDRLKLKVAAPPVEGRANAAVCDFLAEFFELPASGVALVGGAGARQKQVLLRGLPVAAVRQRLAPHLSGC